MSEQQQGKGQGQATKGGGKGDAFVTAITSQAEDYSRWYLDVVLRAELADYTPGLKGCMCVSSNLELSRTRVRTNYATANSTGQVPCRQTYP